MIKLYLFERNVFIAFLFTPFSQQVIRNRIPETEINKDEILYKVGGEIGIQREKIWDPRNHVISNLAH